MMLTGISLGANTGYDINKDFAPIGIVASTPIIVDANPTLPAKSLADVIALAKKDPGKLFRRHAAGADHQLLRREAVQSDGRRRHYVVAYKGTGPLTTDLLGNHVPLGFNTIPASVSQIEAGQLRGLAVAAATRSAALPNVPTAAESGLPGFEAVQYYGVTAPAGMPRPIVDRLNKELRAILTSDDMKKRLIAAGSDPAPGDARRIRRRISNARKANGRR